MNVISVKSRFDPFSRGADTVTLIRSKASVRFLELVVLEILAKPSLKGSAFDS